MTSPVTSTLLALYIYISIIFTAHLWWWAFTLWHISPTCILFMPITIFFYMCICLYIAGCTNGHILLARHSAYLRSLLTHSSPLADDISVISQLISDGEHLFSNIYFVFALCYLLSVCLLVAVWMVSHAWQGIQQSWSLCWCSSPPSSWLHWSRQLSWHISPNFTACSSLMANIKFYSLTYLIYFVYAFYYLLSVWLLQDARINCLTLLARHSAKLTSLLTFITYSWWRLWSCQLSWHISPIFTAHLMVNMYISPILFMPVTIFYLSVYLL